MDKLIKKHLGVNTPVWVIKNVKGLLNEYVEVNKSNCESCGKNHAQVCEQCVSYIAQSTGEQAISKL